jgi:hypothetical protein
MAHWPIERRNFIGHANPGTKSFGSWSLLLQISDAITESGRALYPSAPNVLQTRLTGYYKNHYTSILRNIGYKVLRIKLIGLLSVLSIAR